MRKKNIEFERTSAAGREEVRTTIASPTCIVLYRNNIYVLKHAIEIVHVERDVLSGLQCEKSLVFTVASPREFVFITPILCLVIVEHTGNV